MGNEGVDKGLIGMLKAMCDRKNRQNCIGCAQQHQANRTDHRQENYTENPEPPIKQNIQHTV